jgi:hypothetical protein
MMLVEDIAKREHESFSRRILIATWWRSFVAAVAWKYAMAIT